MSQDSLTASIKTNYPKGLQLEVQCGTLQLVNEPALDVWHFEFEGIVMDSGWVYHVFSVKATIYWEVTGLSYLGKPVNRKFSTEFQMPMTHEMPLLFYATPFGLAGKLRHLKWAVLSREAARGTIKGLAVVKKLMEVIQTTVVPACEGSINLSVELNRVFEERRPVRFYSADIA